VARPLAFPPPVLFFLLYTLAVAYTGGGDVSSPVYRSTLMPARIC